MLRTTVTIAALTIAASCFASSSLTVRADEVMPRALIVAPAAIEFDGPRKVVRLLVTGQFDGDAASDLTREATYESLDENVVAVTKSGQVLPRGDGQTDVVIHFGTRRTRAHVVVRNFDRHDPIDFRGEVIGALARGGCSQGVCHGSPHGKDGFRLSLRGFQPDVGFAALTRRGFARRTNVIQPNESLFLRKATAREPHQGGRRFHRDDPAYEVLLDWVREGCRDSPPPPLARLELLPKSRALHTSSPRQQIVVRAHFDDGSVHDVTHLAVFSSSDDAAAEVTADGLVEFKQTAEVAILVRYLNEIISARLTFVRSDPDFVFHDPPEANYVDRHIFAKHRRLQLTPAPLASDAVFLRRVHLDTIGLLPTPEEAQAFLTSGDPDRRSQLIDRLLEGEEFANFWALKWADVMRGNREAISERGVHVFHRYLTRIFGDDRPMDQFAREILTSLGNTIHVPPANFFRISRTPQEAAESMAQLFLGVRIQCAKCHNHPYEAITQDDYYGLAAYFAQIRLKGQKFGLDDEMVYLDRGGQVKHAATGKLQPPAAFGTPAGDLAPGADLRRPLVNWLTDPKNPYFARSTVNRIWSHLLGRGIVEPVDDFRDSNPPANAELLDKLAREFVRNGFRVKGVIRTILNSRTYQLRAEPAGQSPFAAQGEKYFTHALLRVLSAEQTLDATSSATGVPEPFPGYPLGTRAVELAEGSVDNYFLKAFSKPIRDVACDCARETEPSLNQVIHLINNPTLLDKLESPQGRLAQWIGDGKPTEEIVDWIFLATLSRRPTDAETDLALAHAAKFEDRVVGLRDLQHALINSNEFLLRH